jgi:PsbP
VIKQSKQISRGIMPAFCAAILAVFLVACDTGTGGSTSTPAPKPSPTATPFSINRGTGYTIIYPKGWNVTNVGGDTVSFKDSTGTDNLTVGVSPDSKDITSANALVDAGIKVAKSQLKNPQTEPVPPAATIGGDTWSQKSVSGTTTKKGQNIIAQIVVIADVHPANSAASKGFVIVYGTAKPQFVQASIAYFQPMLQSFKFV